ncbi:MAG: FAD/NAD(P)-binding oxidoreductase [Dehalococcoidia bacterium]
MDGRGEGPGRRHHEVVIIGGGNAGISVAARLRRARKDLDIAIIEPSTKHYYQPLWTLVGGGVFPKERSERDESSVIPRGVTWIRDAVVEACPDEDGVLTAGGERITYRVLVVAPGIQINWSEIEGLPEALGKDGVCSNYSYETVDKMWEFIRRFTGGNAVFTQPATPIKCGGAPQKIAYLADDAFRKAGVREKANIIFATAGAGIFAVEKYANTLRKVIDRKGIDVRYGHNLVAIRAGAREADFERTDGSGRVTIPYELIHVVPPMSAPDFVRYGPLANADGWVDVDKHTLRHVRYPNVYSLGDASSLPTSKTGAAIRKQAPVVVKNVLAALDGKEPAARYDGYTACPIVTGYGRLVMAEFDYDLTPRETFPFDQSKERWTMYQVKKRVLPPLYWRGIMKGRA